MASTRMSAAARTAIQRFSGMLWGIGGMLAMVVVISSLIAGPAPEREASFDGDPWENPDAGTAQKDGDTWSGEPGEAIQLTGLDVTKPVRVVSEDGYTRLTLTGPAGDTVIEDEYGDVPSATLPSSDPMYFVPPAEDIALWPDDDEPWRVTVTQPDLKELSGTVSGIGPAALVYRGEASSARISLRSEYTMWVDLVTSFRPEAAVDGKGSIDRTVAWPDSDMVIFVISGQDSGGWSITVNEDAVSTPTPTETPGEAEDEEASGA